MERMESQRGARRLAVAPFTRLKWVVGRDLGKN